MFLWKLIPVFIFIQIWLWYYWWRIGVISVFIVSAISLIMGSLVHHIFYVFFLSVGINRRCRLWNRPWWWLWNHWSINLRKISWRKRKWTGRANMSSQAAITVTTALTVTLHSIRLLLYKLQRLLLFLWQAYHCGYLSLSHTMTVHSYHRLNH